MISNTTAVSVDNSIQTNQKQNKTNQNPKFKGLGGVVMNLTGKAMNGIENGGFAASFLIQDTLGMTVPRSEEGLKRDRPQFEGKGFIQSFKLMIKNFKDLNFKEGLEVFIREFLSGPLMMFTPFLVFALTKKFLGKSSFTNTALLKKMGKNFTNVVKNKQSDSTAKTIKENFYRKSIKQMIEHTTPNAGKQESQDVAEKIFNHVTKLDELESQLKGAKKNSFATSITNIFRKKSNKIKSEKEILKEQIAGEKSKIVEEFNNFHTSNSSDMNLVNRVKIDNETFSSADSIEAMRNYAFDSIKDDNVANLTEQVAQNIENKSMAKRIFSTVAASAATIGATSIVPSIYALFNPVAPGAIDIAEGSKHNSPVKKDNKQGNNVAFKGNIIRQLQFDGNQLTPVLMTTLAGGGLIVPRLRTAVKRAPIDEETGKKNLIEVPEILTRDVTSTALVTFGVPVLTKMMVNSYQKGSGFVLTNKQEGKISKFKQIIDTLNPLSSVAPYSTKDIKSIYGNIDSKEKLTNFAEFIDAHEGNLVKVFKHLKNGKESFAGTEADFNTISKLDKKVANSKIIKVINETFDTKAVEKLMAAAKQGKENGMYLRARNLNALPRFINTLLLVPITLGVVLPKLVYGVTAKNRKKLELAKQNKTQQAINTNTKNIDKITANTVFKQLKHTN